MTRSIRPKGGHLAKVMMVKREKFLVELRIRIIMVHKVFMMNNNGNAVIQHGGLYTALQQIF